MNDVKHLIMAAQQGDGEAYGRIVIHFQDMAYRVAFGYLGEGQWAQDAAQDAFIDAYRSLPALREPRAFSAWFRRIVLKHCDRQARRRQPELLSDSDWRGMISDLPTPPQMLEQIQLRENIRIAISMIPKIYQAPMIRFYLNGRSLNEIATEMNLPLSTIKKRLFTGRKQLKELLNPMTTYQPSKDDTFANRVQFFIALKNEDLLQVRQLVRKDPDLLETKTEWGSAQMAGIGL